MLGLFVCLFVLNIVICLLICYVILQVFFLASWNSLYCFLYKMSSINKLKLIKWFLKYPKASIKCWLRGAGVHSVWHCIFCLRQINKGGLIINLTPVVKQGNKVKQGNAQFEDLRVWLEAPRYLSLSCHPWSKSHPHAITVCWQDTPQKRQNRKYMTPRSGKRLLSSLLQNSESGLVRCENPLSFTS